MGERVKKRGLVWFLGGDQTRSYPSKTLESGEIMSKNFFVITMFGLLGLTSLVFNGCREQIMEERKGLVTMKGKPVTLLGQAVKVGQKAPDFEVTANDLSPVKFSSFTGKVCIIASVPSLDTAVCDLETRKFNEKAAELGSDVVVLTISMDLPFAQKRWCGAAGIKNVQTLSDYREASFGNAYGVLIKDLRLLARAVFVVDKKGVVRYLQIVPEIATEPDYDAVLKAVKAL
jgi:thioredoxin-dependent peroxiredoxin